jgi:hypothetical protein
MKSNGSCVLCQWLIATLPARYRAARACGRIMGPAAGLIQVRRTPRIPPRLSKRPWLPILLSAYPLCYSRAEGKKQSRNLPEGRSPGHPDEKTLGPNERDGCLDILS